MGIALHRIKSWIYTFVIVVVVALVVVRAYNALQRTTYLTQPIVNTGTGIQVSLSYPAKIPGSKIEASYPLTIAFANQGDLLSAHTYEFIFESPTLIFTDSKGDEVAPRIQITSDYAFIEKSIYVRSFLAEQYPNLHNISVKALADGQELKIQPVSIKIKNEPLWFSYASLFASSILEISVVLGLAGWIIKTLDDAQSTRKEMMGKYRDEVQKLTTLPVLERMLKFIDLENKIKDEHLDEYLSDNLQLIKDSFSDREFLQVVGERMRQDKANELADVEKLHKFFFEKQKDFDKHQEGISALAKILGTLPLDQTPIFLVADIMKLWDGFDADVKDLIVEALNAELVRCKQPDLSRLPRADLYEKVFYNDYRRRLLRSEEIRRIFPQLKPLTALPIGYDAVWLHVQKCPDDAKVIKWLRQHNLIANPFGCDIRIYPFYPQGIRRPNRWESFFDSTPLLAQCPSAEDVYPLAFLLRDECLPPKKVDFKVREVLKTEQRIFPISISLHQENATQLPLVALSHAATRSWLDILPLSPDALLDLPLVSQQVLLELLCWSVGGKETLISLIEQNGLKKDVAGGVLKRKIAEFEGHLPHTYLPQDHVLLSWLKIRPPDLDKTYLILSDEGNPPFVHLWFKQFSPLIPVLLLNEIVTKMIASTPILPAMHLSDINLSWSDEGRTDKDRWLKQFLDGQFDAAMDKNAKEVMGIATRFHELFGPGTEEEITGKLIVASRHSLARILLLGNRLLQKHCGKQEVPEMYLSPEDLDDILKMA